MALPPQALPADEPGKKRMIEFASSALKLLRQKANFRFSLGRSITPTATYVLMKAQNSDLCTKPSNSKSFLSAKTQFTKLNSRLDEN